MSAKSRANRLALQYHKAIETEIDRLCSFLNDKPPSIAMLIAQRVLSFAVIGIVKEGDIKLAKEAIDKIADVAKKEIAEFYDMQ